MNKKWTIEYCIDTTIGKSVTNWFDQLTDEQFKSVAKELKLLEICGNQLRLPHSRPLGAGLFELRERRYGYRIYYGFCKLHIIVLLVIGDKKTQKQDIKIARQRLAQLQKCKG